MPLPKPTYGSIEDDMEPRSLWSSYDLSYDGLLGIELKCSPIVVVTREATGKKPRSEELEVAKIITKFQDYEPKDSKYAVLSNDSLGLGIQVSRYLGELVNIEDPFIQLQEKAERLRNVFPEIDVQSNPEEMIRIYKIKDLSNPKIIRHDTE